MVRIPLDNPGQVKRIGGGSLPLPGGIAQGPDGAIHVNITTAVCPRLEPALERSGSGGAWTDPSGANRCKE